jgi:hypothetical protein
MHWADMADLVGAVDAVDAADLVDAVDRVKGSTSLREPGNIGKDYNSFCSHITSDKTSFF